MTTQANGRDQQMLRSPLHASRKRGIECSADGHDLAPIQRESKRRRRRKSGEGERKWSVSPDDLSSCKDRFMIVSYNILGDDNASKHTDLYEQVDPEDLIWESRLRRICREIIRYKPSIVCLQEVDHFHDFAAYLGKHGFTGVYKGRTGEANDGCAIFWRKNQFSLLRYEDIEYQKFGLRDNVAQLCALKMRLDHSSKQGEEAHKEKTETCSSRTVVVGNIHVLFNPKRGDIKLGQMRLLLEGAHRLAQECGNCPVVLAGDLNSMPQSALYQFLTTSKLNILLHDRRQVSAQSVYTYENQTINSCDDKQRYYASNTNTIYRWSEEELFLAVGKRGIPHLKHPLTLRSAYAGVPDNGVTRDCSGEPLATSYHSNFMGTVDYIWHSLDLLPVRVLDTLPIELLKKTGGLPSQKWGSDHLALVCELAFTS